MTSVLVLHSGGDVRDFFVGALEQAGFDVRVDDAGARPSAVDLPSADVVIASGSVALAAGWLRPDDPAPLPAKPVVLTSEFHELLDAVGSRFGATIAKPATSETIVGAVKRALAGAPSSAPALAADSLESQERDLAVTQLVADHTPDPALFGIAERVARALGVKMALITVIDSEKQTFVAHAGLPADLATAGRTPRSWSFCQSAVRANAAMVVADASQDPRFAATPLVQTKLVGAYAGFPVYVEGIGAVGTVCAIAEEPRDFSASDLAVLDLAASAVSARMSARREASPSSPAIAESEPRDAPASLRVGALLDGKYWITAELGEGGQASVLLARDRLLGHLVAIKLMGDVQNAEATLMREARALVSVRHPNLVAVHGWGNTADGRMYLVLDYIAGERLAERIGSGLPTALVAKIVKELAGALATLHAVGIFHGDVKPANVLLDRSLDRAVLIDLGVGIVANVTPTSSSTGGTPGYSAPEQFFGGVGSPPGARADVYGLAATTYAMLCGYGPFDHERVGKLGAQLRSDYTPVSEVRSDLSPQVDAVLKRALAGDPDLRFASVLEMRDALERALLASDAPMSLRTGGVARTRGRAFRLWYTEASVSFGRERAAQIVGSLSSEVGAIVSASRDDEWYPADAWHALLRSFEQGGAPLDRLGEQVVTRFLPELLSSLHVALTPSTVLHVLPEVARRLHTWLDIAVTRESSGDARVTLRMPRAYAPVVCAAWRGSFRGALIASGLVPEIEEIGCLAHGDAACELALSNVARS